MNIRQIIELDIAKLKREIAYHKAIIEMETENDSVKNSPGETFFIECVFGSLDAYREIGLEVIKDEEAKIAKLECEIAKLKSYLAA